MSSDLHRCWLTVLSFLVYCSITPLLAQDCSNQVYKSVAQTLYERVSFDFTTSCGFWGWRRCRRTRYAAISRVVYRMQVSGTVTYCCEGFQHNTAGICEPICDGSCSNPHYCQSPGNCICIEPGFTGPRCETPICQSGCPSPRVCSAPDVCQCMHGFTGADCSTDIDECEGNKFCEQICNNHRGSYSCACREDFYLANDQVQCIGKSNASLITVNTSALLINLEQPYWDTGGLTQTYNITCFLEDGNNTDLVTVLADSSENETVLDLDTDMGYTCCVSVQTNIGNGPTTCSKVQPIPEPTQPIPEPTTNSSNADRKIEANGTKSEVLEIVTSKVFVIAVASGGGVALLLFTIFLVLLCWCICRYRSSKKSISMQPCQNPLVEGHEYKNELYAMHQAKTDPEKKVAMDDDDDGLQYNAMYNKAVENDYATVNSSQYHYVKHKNVF